MVNALGVAGWGVGGIEAESDVTNETGEHRFVDLPPGTYMA